jgi:formylglycine-generating enzyme required for sulfatase activity/predicted Ser/Thr protein kinase
MIACPSAEKLSEFLSGSCPADESTRIESHISECPACCEFCLSAGSDGELLSEIRGAMECDEVVYSPIPASVQAAEVPEVFPVQDHPPGADSIEGYRLIRELGRGGMGVVYLAHQNSTKREVALKVLIEGPFASTTARRRFEREVELASRFTHPHIVTVLESGLARGRPYVAMQYIAGERLDRFVKNRALAVRDILLLFAKICRAVGYAHQRGVIHRDLKPSNILVDSAGEPHVLDFGLAKQEHEIAPYTVSVAGQLVGTVPYMSPEQVRGSADIDVRSDVYALGVVLYRLLTGRFPYDVTKDVRETFGNIASAAPIRPRQVRRDLERDVETIVLRALAKEPARRYQSAAQFAEDIERFLSRKPIEARRDEAFYVATKFLGRHRMGVSIALVLAGLSTVAGMATIRQRAAQVRQEVATLLAQVVDDFTRAAALTAVASPAVQGGFVEATRQYVESPAYTERITGARGAILADPAAFWASVEGGMLGINGEWLEIAELPPDSFATFMPEFLEKARSGTNRQKYVAFCLIGQFSLPNPMAAKICEESAKSESNAGVAAAARWAAQRLGVDVAAARTDATIPDDISGLTFVRIPGIEVQSSGPRRSDTDAFSDEGLPMGRIQVEPFLLASSEVTWKAFKPFIAHPAASKTYERRDWMEHVIEALPEKSRPETAVGYVTLDTARAYCRWLSQRGETASPPHRYRLPTEAEWEHACRGGGSRRFCYGDNAKYARYFARCEGNDPSGPTAGSRMPNEFGIFDMHGGLWEWTNSRYPPELLTDTSLKEQELWIYRGGAYYSPAVRCRCAQRNYGSGAATDYNGFRIVLEFVEP